MPDEENGRHAKCVAQPERPWLLAS